LIGAGDLDRGTEGAVGTKRAETTLLLVGDIGAGRRIGDGVTILAEVTSCAAASDGTVGAVVTGGADGALRERVHGRADLRSIGTVGADLRVGSRRRGERSKSSAMRHHGGRSSTRGRWCRRADRRRCCTYHRGKEWGGQYQRGSTYQTGK